MIIRTNALLRVFCLLGFLLLTAVAQADQLSLEINVDTSSIDGVQGYLDFQFNVTGAPADPAIATISGFASDGTLTGVPFPDIGQVTGTLPGDVAITSTNPSSEHTESFTFGSFFNFSLTLDIPVVSGTALFGNSFFLSTLDPNGTPLLTNGDPSLLEIDLAAATGSPSLINNSSRDQANVNLAPEPASFLLLAMGLLVVAAKRGRRSD